MGVKRQDARNARRRIERTIAFFASVVIMFTGAGVQADDHPIAPVVADHVFVVPGVSVRNGDWVAFEPALWLTRTLVGPGRPIVFVVRGIVGLGGSGAAIGIAPTLEPPCPTRELCTHTPFFWPPASLEGRVERMYGLTHWRAATYAGPHLSLSAYLIKASIGWMVDVNDRSDNHVQVGIGFGF